MPIDPYATVRPLFPTAKPAGLNTSDADRVRAYDIYDGMYWNVPETYKIIPRSADVAPIYLPAPRSLVEATHRFLAVDWDFLVNPDVGTTPDQDAVKLLFQAIWKRETMYTKFVSQKRNGLIRGDAFWHITADPSKADTERISIHELHPGNYFPIFDADNADRIVGCHIVDTIPDPKDPSKVLSRRQTYRKTETGGVTSELAHFEIGKWDDRHDPADAVKVTDITPLFELPPAITTIPVYHIKNFGGSDLFGSSQLRGIETIMAAVCQAVSDQDLALSLQGLGVYWTNAGPPRDASGNAVPFTMGPGEVVELPADSEFGRVSGISGSLPGIEHMKFLLDQASESVGIPDVARGRADVQVAESGVSLMLQMAPLLSQNGEKEVEMLGVYDQMFHDIQTQWLVAYEGLSPTTVVEVTSVVGDPMPVNRESKIAEILTLTTSVPALITIEMAQAELAKLGYEFPEGAAAQVIKDTQDLSAARSALDPFAQRLGQEGDPNAQVPPAA